MTKIYTVEYLEEYSQNIFFGAFTTKERAIEVRDKVRQFYFLASVYEIDLNEEPQIVTERGRPWVRAIWPNEVDT